MELMALCALIGASLLANGAFAYRLRAEQASLKAEREALAKRPKTVEAQEVLADLTRGGAILQITVLNSEDLYLRTPR